MQALLQALVATHWDAAMRRKDRSLAPPRVFTSTLLLLSLSVILFLLYASFKHRSKIMGRETSDESRLLLKKCSIFFEGPIEPTEWPNTHQSLFGAIQELGKYRYTAYEEVRKTRSTDQPWGSDILRRADRINSIAKRCYREKRNEAGWRLSLEPELFARFAVEVAWYAFETPAYVGIL